MGPLSAKREITQSRGNGFFSFGLFGASKRDQPFFAGRPPQSQYFSILNAGRLFRCFQKKSPGGADASQFSFVLHEGNFVPRFPPV